MFSALLSTAQAPLGGAGPHYFPAWILQASYAGLAAIGLSSWLYILRTGAGLKDDMMASMSKPEGNGDIEAPPPEVSAELKISCAGVSQADGNRDMEYHTPEVSNECKDSSFSVRSFVRGFACPKSLLGPVILGGVVSQVCYWSLTQPVGVIAAKMIDPVSCSGAVGSSLFKFANTAQFCLVPIGSLLSSFGRCPRAVFYMLSFIQICCVLSLWMCLLGFGREEFWQTEGGRVLFAITYPLIGGLEGYLVTMAYRYVGDDEGIPTHLRDSASKIMSWAAVWVVNLIQMGIGAYLLSSSFACSA